MVDDTFTETLRGKVNKHIILMGRFLEKHEGQWTPFDRSERLAIRLFAEWLDDKNESLQGKGERVERLAEMNEGLRDNKRYLENDLALKMEQIAFMKTELVEKQKYILELEEALQVRSPR